LEPRFEGGRLLIGALWTPGFLLQNNLSLRKWEVQDEVVEAMQFATELEKMRGDAGG